MADDVRDVLPLFGRQFRSVRLGVVVGTDDLVGPLHRGVQQTLQPDRITGPRLERFVVRAQHRAKFDVPQFDVPVAPAPSGREQLVEVLALAKVDDVQDRVG